MYWIAICDDDTGFSEKLNSFLVQIFSEYNVQPKIFIFTDGKSLIKVMEDREQYFNIIFLDIQMPQMDGFSTAQKLRELDDKFLLLFTTNLENSATEGYKYNAFRYILKRRLKEDLDEAIKKIVLKAKDNEKGNEEITFRTVDSGEIGATITIKKNDIIFFTLEKRRVKMVTLYREYELLTYPLQKYLTLLDSDNFEILLRSHIINWNHVKTYNKTDFLLTGNQKIFLGDSEKSIRESKEKFLAYSKRRN